MNIEELKEKLENIFNCKWGVIEEEDARNSTILTQPKGKWNNVEKTYTHKTNIKKRKNVRFICCFDSEKNGNLVQNIFTDYNINLALVFPVDGKFIPCVCEKMLNIICYIEICLIDAKLFVGRWEKVKKLFDSFKTTIQYKCFDCNKEYNIENSMNTYLNINEGKLIKIIKNQCPYCKSKKIKIINN